MPGLLCVCSTVILCETLGEPLNLLEFRLLDLPDSNVLRIQKKLSNLCQAQNPVCPAPKPCLLASLNSQGASHLWGEPQLESVHRVEFVGPQGERPEEEGLSKSHTNTSKTNCMNLFPFANLIPKTTTGYCNATYSKMRLVPSDLRPNRIHTEEKRILEAMGRLCVFISQGE